MSDKIADDFDALLDTFEGDLDLAIAQGKAARENA
jgi:hypothetical protein